MRLVISLLLLAQIGCSYAQTSTSSATLSFDHSHEQFTQLLQDVVHKEGQGSRVDYVQLSENSSSLVNYLASVSSVSQQQFDTFSKDEQLAFLINAYNAYQLKLVIDHYPIDSIMDVGNIFRSPWSMKFFQLFGDDASLNHIEHDLIRKLFDEPRIHFAVNCASISCPPLQSVAYRADMLDQQLEAAAVNFLNDKNMNRVDVKEEEILLSKIFDWYDEDFDDLKGFVLSKMIDVDLAAKQYDIDHIDYDWGLNEYHAR